MVIYAFPMPAGNALGVQVGNEIEVVVVTSVLL